MRKKGTEAGGQRKEGTPRRKAKKCSIRFDQIRTKLFSCYIILRGTVTVYVRRIDDVDQFQEDPSTRMIVKNYKDRSKFGAELGVLKSGDKFGDLCFFKSNDERNATVIADDDLDLMVIGKEVYRINFPRIFEDLKDQLRFMETSKLFKGFPYDYRITLMEKMRARRVDYGTAIVHQGDPVTSVFMICRGEALLKVNPLKLNYQYELPSKDGSSSSRRRPLTVIQRRREILKHGYIAGEKLLKQRNVTVATVGLNELIGDVEFILSLPTHHVTAVCNSSMLLVEMEVTELYRLVLKRDVGVSDCIYANVLCKLNARANRCTDVPQYRELHQMGLKELKRKQATTQGNTRGEEPRSSTTLTVGNVVRLATRWRGLAKNDQTPTKDQPSDSKIAKALKKTITVAVEIGGGDKLMNKIVDSAKRHQEGMGETTCPDNATATRLDVDIFIELNQASSLSWICSRRDFFFPI